MANEKDDRAGANGGAGERSQAYDAVVQQGTTAGVGAGGEKVFLSPYRHPPFGDDVRALLEELRAALAEVHPLSLDQWEDGFRRDTNPEREIAIWLHLSTVYQRLTKEVFQRLGPEHRAAIFRVLLAASTSEEAAVQVAQETGMPPQLVERIVRELRGSAEGARS